MGKTLSKIQLIDSILIIFILFFVPGLGFSDDSFDRLMEKCSEGDMKSCDEINKLTDKYRSQIDHLNAQADRFHADTPSLGIQNGNNPNFKRAYSIILVRYIVSDTIEPAHKRRGLNEKTIEICSQHFNDLFLKYGKNVPKTESGDTDWGMIYLMTIDHYFRFCSNKVEESSIK